MKPFDSDLSLKIDRATIKYESSKAIRRIWYWLVLWWLECKI